MLGNMAGFTNAFNCLTLAGVEGSRKTETISSVADQYVVILSVDNRRDFA